MAVGTNYTQEAVDVWNRVLETAPEFGIELKIAPADMDNFTIELYTARKALGDPLLNAFSVVKLKGGSLWIIRKEVSLEEPNAAPLP